jgi:acetylornithine deacetylase/succinyl-diaminopimelate desuccinylase-like protein
MTSPPARRPPTGVEGAHAEPGAKTVIPGTVKGKFSLRIVPNQGETDKGFRGLT